MSGIVTALLGDGGAKAAKQAAAEQEARAQSDQGQQLALLSRGQAQSDNAAAAINAPGIGSQIMGYNRRTAATLGG